MDYNLRWSDLNERLRQTEAATGELAAALAELEAHQRDCGFIKDDLADVERLVFADPDDPTRTFRAQVNPKRARRHGGAGVTTPPPDEENLHDGCFLCRENIRWQQNQMQVGFEIATTQDAYHAWMNPFPLLHNHIVVAAAEHVSQEWDMAGSDSTHIDLRRMLNDLCETAGRLPSHVGFYNGVDAGASIPGHLHFQFFHRPTEDPIFPLEQRRFIESDVPDEPMIASDYPVPVALWRGTVAEVVDAASSWVRTWVKANDNRLDRLSSNFIAAGHACGSGVSLYFVPRDRDRQWWNGDKGIVGGLELLGELVLASAEECAMVASGEVDYAFIERALGAVHTPFIED